MRHVWLSWGPMYTHRGLQAVRRLLLLCWLLLRYWLLLSRHRVRHTLLGWRSGRGGSSGVLGVHELRRESLTVHRVQHLCGCHKRAWTLPTRRPLLPGKVSSAKRLLHFGHLLVRADLGIGRVGRRAKAHWDVAGSHPRLHIRLHLGVLKIVHPFAVGGHAWLRAGSEYSRGPGHVVGHSGWWHLRHRVGRRAQLLGRLSVHLLTTHGHTGRERRLLHARGVRGREGRRLRNVGHWRVLGRGSRDMGRKARAAGHTAWPVHLHLHV
jgi:hypothetical protein